MTTTTEDIIFELKQYKNELQNLMREFSRFARFELTKSEDAKQKSREYQDKIVKTEHKISILREILDGSFAG